MSALVEWNVAGLVVVVDTAAAAAAAAVAELYVEEAGVGVGGGVAVGCVAAAAAAAAAQWMDHRPKGGAPRFATLPDTRVEGGSAAEAVWV